jgi:DNA-binding CsgD family transcriptional regulator
MDSIVFDAILEYVREYHRCDPHVTYTGNLPVGAVINTADVFPRQEFKAHPFYREYWAAFGVRELLAAKIAEDDRFVVMLGMSRTQELPRYGSSEIRKLERYVGHLASAFRIVRHLGTVQATAQAGLAIIQSSTRPMILLAADLQIIHANTLALDLLRKRIVLCEEHTRLCGRTEVTTLELERGMTALGFRDRGERPYPSRVALRFDGNARENERLLCSLWAMRPHSTMGAFGPVLSALLTVTGSTATADPIFIGSMFDLTPAEAKLAVALLDGGELKGIAAAQHVSLETVRAQLKSIFLKTQTHRQSDLIALLMRATAG